MIKLDKTFIAGKMNKDIDERLIPDGEYLDALNVTIDTSQGSTIGAVQNSRGNDKMSDIATVTGLAVVNARAIGAVAYEAQNLIYWLVTSDNFDAVFEYNQLTDVTTKVLLSTTGQLNFNKNYCVTGINYIPAFGDLGPFLFWSDGLNPPRRINIARAKSWSDDDPRIDLDTQVILRPPLNAPKIYLKTDGDPETTNNIERKFLYFAYRYKYVDNQYSSMSPFSGVAFQGDTFFFDFDTGDNTGMKNVFNKIDVTFDTGNQFVKEIQVVFYDTSGLNTYVIDNYNKGEIGLSDNVVYTIEFSNNKIYGPLDVSQITRLFDNVPLLAKCQNVIGNRLVYGNYTQFRDLKDAFNQDILIDYSVEVVSDPITSTSATRTFRSDRDYEIGLVYTDEYGRMTTVLTTENNSVYVPSTKSDYQNSIRVTLNNQAPNWATNFRFVLKQPTGEYYNIFPQTFFIDGQFRYFLINESDRDKIIVGEYIIFKTASFTATHVNTKFKILELEYKQASFITSAPEGLYFKIKTDGSAFLNDGSTYTAYNASTGRGPKSITNPDPHTVQPVKRTTLPSVNITPIFYSVSGIYTTTTTSPSLNADITSLIANTDSRVAIRILTSTSYEYTRDIDLGSAIWSGPFTIPSTLSDTLTLGTSPTSDYVELNIRWDSDTGYTPGDVFIFNVRGYNVIGSPNSYTGTPLSPGTNNGLYGNQNVINMPKADYGGAALINFNSPIYPFAEITIKIVRDGVPASSDRQYTNTWINGTKYYQNLEEWFWREGYSTFDQYDQSVTLVGGANYVTFRSGTGYNKFGYPGDSNYMYETSAGNIYMIIRGFGTGNLTKRNEITVELTVKQSPGKPKLSAETVPTKTDNDIYYELSKTYRIENGLHKVSWVYSDFTDGSTVFPSIPEVAGLTVLGPLDPNNPLSTDAIHSFNVGEIIYVKSDNPSIGPPDGYYNITYVTDYAIAIDLPFPGTGPVTGGKVYYNINEQDQTTSIPLVIDINHPTSQNSDFNAFAFGNGVESNRILDAFLQPQMRYSQRALTTIEDYKQQKKETSLTYSGVYVGATQLNNLNEFNLSTGNFKNLDVTYGPIQKLYARDTDLLVLHQDKITSVLYGKNLLVDAVGGGQVASVPEVLGNQVAHPSEYGISNNPESFARHSNVLFFADARRGAVLQMINDEVIEISDSGMKNYFRDTMKDNPNTQKLGSFDPFNNQYVISFNDQSVNPCELSIAPTISVTSAAAKTLFLFTITSNTSWTLSSNQTWLTLPISSGFGNEDIYGSVELNDVEMFRSAKVTITYCDGLEQEFTLLQLATPT
jgi:hypothetical protein